ncbi:MAG: DUF4292 domain-containing protein [Flavobacteriales bacterium]|nr:DUF4292 domain-containing protein [Flavobacteriales bacterium]MCB9197815.1 DUF4292 domain-containing protein [Flavobacteriales bacterium]
MSCKSKKNGTNEVKLKNYSDKELIDLMAASNITCTTLKSKGNVDVSFRGEDYSLRANFRVKKDSATWISLSKSTIPVATSVISNDSLKLLVKVGTKGYYLNTIDKINELINSDVDYELLEDFFLGNAVAFDYENEYKVEKDDGAYLISSEKSKKIEKLLKKGKIKDEPILYRCWIEPVNFRCKRVIINLLDQDAELTVTYSNWEDMNGDLFPMSASLKLVTPTDSAALNVDYTKVECDPEINFPFRIPDSYEPIEIGSEK